MVKSDMDDLYAVLGVHPDASVQEIKRAFRKNVKFSHPDTGARDPESIRRLLDAYKILSNPNSRREYDRKRLRIIRAGSESSFNYRLWLKERLDEPEYIVKLIFYDLLHGFEEEALDLYDSIAGIDLARMERFFERSEAMDAEFCIAEEYMARGRFHDAYRVLKKLISMEKRSSGFGYFFEVVLLTFRRLVLDSMNLLPGREQYLTLLDDALALKSSAENDAVFFRKKAEVLLELKRIDEAKEALKHAVTIMPRLGGLKKLKTSLASSNAQELENMREFL
ncbi:DnaJ domain-containing protein [Spirochaetota bacterium]